MKFCLVPSLHIRLAGISFRGALWFNIARVSGTNFTSAPFYYGCSRSNGDKFLDSNFQSCGIIIDCNISFSVRGSLVFLDIIITPGTFEL